jgi:hypothetical protein
MRIPKENPVSDTSATPNLPEGAPPENGSAGEAQDLISQARKLRQTRSTAQIILKDKQPPRFSRKTLVYASLAGACLLVLLYLFLVPGPRNTLQDRAGDFSQAMASDRPASQAVAPANAYTPPPADAASSAAAEPPAGPYSIETGTPAVWPAPGAAAAEPPAPPPPPPPRSQRAAAPEAPAPAPAPAPRKPQPAVSTAAAARGIPAEARPAYQLLLELKPAFSGLLRGDTEEYRLQDSSAQAKGPGLYVFDFAFQQASAGEPAHFMWEVDLGSRTAKPIGLTATKFDRQQLRNR